MKDSEDVADYTQLKCGTFVFEIDSTDSAMDTWLEDGALLDKNV